MMLDHDIREAFAAPAPNAARHEFHVHRNVEVWTWSVAVAIAAELRRDLHARPRSRLLLSGGKTPGSVYKALAMAPLEWERIDVGLVDERWLMPDDPDSNAWLVRQTLLREHAAQARFEALTLPGRSIEEAVAVANAHAQQPACIAVLGMGNDGHVGSLFPGMTDLDRALQSRHAYVAVDTYGVASADPWHRRISLTPTGLGRAQTRILLIRGADKRLAFERAVHSANPYHWPILAARNAGDSPLQVHWCA